MMKLMICAYFEAQKEIDKKREISINTTEVESIDKNVKLTPQILVSV